MTKLLSATPLFQSLLIKAAKDKAITMGIAMTNSGTTFIVISKP